MEVAKEKKSAFIVPFILSGGNTFNICVLSQCIVHWINLQNIHSFTYQKILLHTLFCLFLKCRKTSVYPNDWRFPRHSSILLLCKEKKVFSRWKHWCFFIKKNIEKKLNIPPLSLLERIKNDRKWSFFRFSQKWN